jgi:hypothetical protein
LGATIASFEQSTKPQVFPWLATSFIKNERRSSVFASHLRRTSTPQSFGKLTTKSEVTPGLLALFDY